MVAAKTTSKRQITVPKEVRDRLGVGSILEFRGLFRVREARPYEEEREAAWDAVTERLRPDRQG